VVGAPDSDPARFDKIPSHAGSESGAPGAVPGCVLLRCNGIASLDLPERRTITSLTIPDEL